jgi:selenocysteine lyase/cysteine desulfurase
MKGVKLMGRPMYLDFQATTPMDPRVLDAMLPFMVEQYGNAHSRTHYFGWESEQAVEQARKVGFPFCFQSSPCVFFKRLAHSIFCFYPGDRKWPH